MDEPSTSDSNDEAQTEEAIGTSRGWWTRKKVIAAAVAGAIVTGLGGIESAWNLSDRIWGDDGQKSPTASVTREAPIDQVSREPDLAMRNQSVVKVPIGWTINLASKDEDWGLAPETMPPTNGLTTNDGYGLSTTWWDSATISSDPRLGDTCGTRGVTLDNLTLDASVRFRDLQSEGSNSTCLLSSDRSIRVRVDVINWDATVVEDTGSVEGEGATLRITSWDADLV